MAHRRPRAALLLSLVGAAALRGLAWAPSGGPSRHGWGPLVARRARPPSEMDRDAAGAGVGLQQVDRPEPTPPERAAEPEASDSAGGCSGEQRRGSGSWQWKPRPGHGGGYEGSDRAERPSAERVLSATERQALRLPAINEEKEVLERQRLEDAKFAEALGPFGGWVFDKCQPRKWGPNGIVAFKAMYLMFMWTFMMAVFPILLDIVITMGRLL